MRLAGLTSIFIALALSASDLHAIDLNFTYVDSGLAPAADSDGSRLMNLFDFAEAFYEDVFEDPDFTSNIDVSYANLPSLLGLYYTATNVIEIERAPTDFDWFIDDTPADNSEFTLVQFQWRDLSAAEKADGFNYSEASSVPATFEVGFQGMNGPSETLDMLTTVMHEVGHALGVNSISIFETADFDYDFDSEWLFGADLAAKTQGLDLGHLNHPQALMNIGSFERRDFPSHIDLLSMAAANGFDDLDIPRREFYGGEQWTTDGNWTGNRRPGAFDEAFVRLTTATVSSNAEVGTLNIHEGAGVILSAGVKLDLDNNDGEGNPNLGDVNLLDLNSFLRINQGGELEARDVWLGSNAKVDLRGGAIDATSVLIRPDSTLSSTGPGAAFVEVDAFENSGLLLVDGGDLTLDASSTFRNSRLIRVANGSTLTLQSTSASPWLLNASDGAFLAVDVDGGNLEIVSGRLPSTFGAIMRIANGASVDMSEPWEIGGGSAPTAALQFEGTGGVLTGAPLTMRGHLEVVEGLAEIDAPLTASSVYTAPGLITVRSGAALQQDGAYAQGAGVLVVESGAEATFNASVELGQYASGVIDGDLIFNGRLLFMSDDYTGNGRHVHNAKSDLLSSANVSTGTVEVGDVGILLINAAALSSAGLEVRGQVDLANKGSWENSATALVNSNVGDPAVVTVDALAKWTIGGNLTIGTFTNVGSGRVVLTDGLIDVTAQAGIAPRSSLHVDGGEFASGILSMSSDATFEQTGGEVSVGEFNKQGVGTFSFSGGEFEVDGGAGTFNSALAYGGAESNQPTFRVVNGADVTVTSSWHIGAAAGTFATTVVSGRGSTLSSTGVNPGADLYVGRFGAGTLIVEDGGLADFGDDFELARDGVDSAGVATVRGVSNVAGAIVRSEVRVTRNGTGAALTVGRLGDGELNIESGARVVVGGVVSVGTNPDSTGLVNIVGSSDGFPAELDAPESVVRVGATTGSGNNASLNVFTGGLLNADRLEVRQRGIANLLGGEMRLDLLDLSDAQAFNMSDGLLNVLTVNGALAPTGGVVAPRGEGGVLLINGFYQPSADAVLEIDIVGSTTSDLVAMDGFATLGGELRVLLDDSYVPGLGDAFSILIANSVAGTFDVVTLPELAANLGWEIDYGPTSVSLDVVASVLPGDFEGDGDVDGFDFMTWQRDPSIGSLADWEANYGVTVSAGIATLAENAVPEPSALALQCGGLLVLASRRRRTR